MMNMWYEKIIEKINNADYEKVLFMKDNYNLFSFQKLKNNVKYIFSNIVYYKSELKLRAYLRNKKGNILVIVNKEQDLPYDFEKNYPVIEIGYSDIFPKLNENALDWLNGFELQELYSSYKSNRSYENLTFKQTIDFIIEELYNTNLNFFSEENLISFLIKYYFLNDKLKPPILKYMNDKINELDLDLNISELDDKNSFFNWLNNKWREHILNNDNGFNFNHLGIRYLLMDCFDQGLLEQIDVLREDVEANYLTLKGAENYWIKSGLKNYGKINLLESINSDKEYLKELLNKELKIRDWGRIAKIWSNLLFVKADKNINIHLNDLMNIMDSKFHEFIESDYNDLAYDHRFFYSPLNSRILPKVLDKSNKLAIICFDGMSFKEWPIIERYLESKLDISFNLNFSISIIPSVTKYSRRAIFSGKLPVEDDFRSNEEKIFIEYIIENSGIADEEVYFSRTNNPEKINFIGYKAAGLIYNFVDNLAHSAQRQRMLLNNIKENLNTHNLDCVISELLNKNFNIYFTSDHGNVFAEGNNVNPNKGFIDEKASRALIYDNSSLANNELFEDKKVFYFPNILGDKFVVTMLNRKKFGGKEPGFTHGGINIEELIIPFVEVIK